MNVQLFKQSFTMGKPMVEFSRDAEDGAFVLKCSVVLPQPRARVFEFFADAFQLEQITPPWLNFRVLTKAPIGIQAGCLIDYRLKLHGIPIRWRTEISSWDPPTAFVDRQLKGPYLLWEHLHTFEETDGGTLCRDEVRYRVPGGWLIERLFVRPDLRRIFEYRHQKMLELFPAAGG